MSNRDGVVTWRLGRSVVLGGTLVLVALGGFSGASHGADLRELVRAKSAGTPVRGRVTLPVDVPNRQTQVFRAELVLHPPAPLQPRPTEPTRVFWEGQPEKPLAFVSPRNVGLDVTAAVQAVVRQGKPLVLKVDQTCNGISRLEVSYLGMKPKGTAVPGVSQLKATHRAGQTLLTFREPVLETWPEFKTGADVRDFATKFQEKYGPYSFRIWRSSERITSDTIPQAKLVGECGFLTCWNDTYHQEETKNQPPLRYRVQDLGPEVEWGTGIYAHNPVAAGRAFYAVTVAVNGVDDLTQISSANSLQEPVEEVVGQGEPILQWKETPETWQYRTAAKGSHLVRLIYTRWEAWPHASRPSVPIDYLVAIARDKLPPQGLPPGTKQAARVDPAPVGIHLHNWGGSLNQGYGWWYNAHRGAVLISSNQIPYDWWTGYHSAVGTSQTFGDGQVQPFTMNRLWSFFDWATRQHRDAPEAVRADWPMLDTNRVFTAGSSMGGSGSGMWGVRFGDRVAWSIGWVGVHIPEESPHFKNAYKNYYGPRDPAITMPDGKTSPWDYFHDVQWLQANPLKETALIIASNGKNDANIGWPQAVKFARALQETRRPHRFNWGLQGHATRTLVEANFDLDLRIDQSLPAFTRCSLDQEIGTGTPVVPTANKTAAVAAPVKNSTGAAGAARKEPPDPYDGASIGAYNAYLSWDTASIVDETQRWEISAILERSAPQDRCTVDITPRRLQSFRIPMGGRFDYHITHVQTRQVLQQGTAAVDKLGLLTLPQVPLLKGHNRVVITPAAQ